MNLMSAGSLCRGGGWRFSVAGVTDPLSGAKNFKNIILILKRDK
jgi:hypothetical protein